MKEQELQKKIEEISSYCDNRWAENVALDLERLETALLTLKGEVQTIESSLDWANTCLLTRAVQGLASSLEGIFELLEQGKFRMQSIGFNWIPDMRVIFLGLVYVCYFCSWALVHV